MLLLRRCRPLRGGHESGAGDGTLWCSRRNIAASRLRRGPAEYAVGSGGAERCGCAGGRPGARAWARARAGGSCSVGGITCWGAGLAEAHGHVVHGAEGCDSCEVGHGVLPVNDGCITAGRGCRPCSVKWELVFCL
mmetsp:Transcript_162619/g.516657  ORF Transcript_162619/g.516657 Transcript_162619/m.516657 type:complete len:136 (+) Transcript_162619:87-494(+)